MKNSVFNYLKRTCIYGLMCLNLNLMQLDLLKAGQNEIIEEKEVEKKSETIKVNLTKTIYEQVPIEKNLWKSVKDFYHLNNDEKIRKKLEVINDYNAKNHSSLEVKETIQEDFMGFENGKRIMREDGIKGDYIIKGTRLSFPVEKDTLINLEVVVEDNKVVDPSGKKLSIDNYVKKEAKKLDNYEIKNYLFNGKTYSHLNNIYNKKAKEGNKVKYSNKLLENRNDKLEFLKDTVNIYLENTNKDTLKIINEKYGYDIKSDSTLYRMLDKYAQETDSSKIRKRKINLVKQDIQDTTRVYELPEVEAIGKFINTKKEVKKLKPRTTPLFSETYSQKEKGDLSKPDFISTTAFELNILASYFVLNNIFYGKYNDEKVWGREVPFHFSKEPHDYANGVDAYGGNLLLLHSGSTFFSMAYKALGHKQFTADLLGALNTAIIYSQAKYIEGTHQQGADLRDLKAGGIGLGLFIAQSIEREVRKDEKGLLNRIKPQFWWFPEEKGKWDYAKGGTDLDNYAGQKFFWQVRFGDLLVGKNKNTLEKIISGLSIGPGFGLSRDGFVEKYISLGFDLNEILSETKIPKQIITALNYIHFPNIAIKFGEDKKAKVVLTF
ncbi:MAG: hypothetical protein AABW56_05370 [Nanoarchaeota archaeon]